MEICIVHCYVSLKLDNCTASFIKKNELRTYIHVGVQLDVLVFKVHGICMHKSLRNKAQLVLHNDTTDMPTRR